MEGTVEVDKTYVGGQDDEALGRNEGKKKLVGTGIEKKGRGISRMHGKVIETAEKKHLKSFMIDNIHSKAHIRTDGWPGYRGLSTEFPNIVHKKLEKKGKNFPQLNRAIMMFEAWLRGIHNSVSYLRAYLNEYTYRFNRHKMREGIFENLMNRMISKPPFMYKMITNQ